MCKAHPSRCCLSSKFFSRLDLLSLVNFEDGMILNLFRRNKVVTSSVMLVFLCLNLSQSLFAGDGGNKKKKKVAPEDAFSRAAAYHLPSLGKLEQKELDLINKIKEENQKLIAENKNPNFQPIPTMPPVGHVEALRLTYDIFGTESLKKSKKLKEEKILLSDNCFEDLEIFCGNSRKNRERNLFSILNNNRTPFGKAVFQSFFTKKYENIEQHTKEIERRQTIVKCLVEDKILFDSIDSQLKIAAKNSANLMYFYKMLDSMATEFLSKIYFNKRLGINFASMNENTFMMNFPARWYLVEKYPLLIPTLIYSLKFRYLDAPKILVDLGIPVNDVNLRYSTTLFAFMLFTVSFGFSMLIDLISGFPTYKLIKSCENHINEKMYALANLVGSMHEIGGLVQENKQLSELFANIGWLQNSQKSTEAAQEFNELLDSLKSGTFTGETSFFSNKGKVLASFKKMQRLNNEMVGSLMALGELDACMSIAKLYKKFAQDSNVKFCFPKFVKADKPYINIQNFWHPFLNPKSAVPNSIELGGDLGQNVILTGPNAAGKSSSLKGIILSIILAQTLGIAPASEMALTPFARINSHLNISDDEGRESLYQAEKNRVKGFLNEIKQLGANEFEFAIMDEMFSSTNPEEGQSAAYAIAKSLVKVPNCMCLLATHFKKLTELEADTNGYFKNYKVYVEELSDGKYHCPYKIVPGISNQSIAISMLKDEFDAEIVSEAYDVLSQIKEDTSDILGFEQREDANEIEVS